MNKKESSLKGKANAWLDSLWLRSMSREEVMKLADSEFKQGRLSQSEYRTLEKAIYTSTR